MIGSKTKGIFFMKLISVDFLIVGDIIELTINFFLLEPNGILLGPITNKKLSVLSDPIQLER